MDGTHINIKQPTSDFIDQKLYKCSGMLLVGLSVIDVVIKCPGSVHDAHVLQIQPYKQSAQKW